MNTSYVLDANALLDLMVDGAGAQSVERLIKSARLDAPLLISIVNWGEIFCISWQRHGEESARKKLADLSQLPLTIVPVDLAQGLKAAELKAVHKIPYVDCLAAALAVLKQSHSGHLGPRLRKAWPPFSRPVARPQVAPLLPDCFVRSYVRGAVTLVT